MPNSSFFQTFACISGAAGVAAGCVLRATECAVVQEADLTSQLPLFCSAFGAHALRPKLTAYQLGSWQTATTYQMIHSIALLVASTQPATQACTVASYAFATGITMFSGSIYGLCLTSEGNGLRKALGPVTPIGGFAFIVGWVALALSKRGGAGNLRL